MSKSFRKGMGKFQDTYGQSWPYIKCLIQTCSSSTYTFLSEIPGISGLSPSLIPFIFFLYSSGASLA